MFGLVSFTAHTRRIGHIAPVSARSNFTSSIDKTKTRRRMYVIESNALVL